MYRFEQVGKYLLRENKCRSFVLQGPLCAMYIDVDKKISILYRMCWGINVILRTRIALDS